MKNEARFSLRIERELLDKFTYIAEYNGRSTNRELEMLIRRYVRSFEKQNEPIVLPLEKEN